MFPSVIVSETKKKVLLQKKSGMQIKFIKSKLEEEKKPSNTDDVDWIYAESKKDYPASTENSGKWLIFVYLKYIDEVWNKISSMWIVNVILYNFSA